MLGIIDLDFVKYSIASIGEKRSIIVTHLPSGRDMKFNNRTEFYGRGKKKDGGWLGEKNSTRTSPFELDEFTIEDKQEITSPIENVLHSAKVVVESSLKGAGIKGNNFVAYLGKGAVFRNDLATLLEYKGNRKDTLKPLLLDDVTEYLAKKYKAEYITDIEADDMCVIKATEEPDSVIIGVDKDYKGCEANFYNVNKPDEGIRDCKGFGELWIDAKNKVDGKGRLFKYFQIASQDTADNYKASCMSSLRWGDKAAYKALQEATNDKEAWIALKEVFQKLYPEPKIVTGWRGDDFEIDWLYVLQEMTHLAHMQRWRGDSINVRDVYNKLEIKI